MRRHAFLRSLLLGTFTAATALVTVARPATAQTGSVTTLIFVRHAEAGAGDPRNPSLTPAGEQRAQTLLKALSSAGVGAVYTSEYARTQQTGGVVAAAAGVTPVTVPVSASSAAPGGAMPAASSIEERSKEMIARILREQQGKTVLVVGHSNTVPLLVKIASGEAVDAIADTEFDRMYVVTIRDGVAHVIKARY
jgi:broad specificity phosphatase PhoE